MNLIQIIKRKAGLKLLLTTMIVLYSVSVFSQNHTVTGVIKDDATNEALIGVSIKVKGQSIGTITNLDGKYSISVDPNSTLEYSYLGYKTVQIAIAGKSVINVSLVQDVVTLNEVVAIGYGTQKKKELTGAVTQIKSEDMSKIAASDFTKTLQGQVAGVSVSESSGRPGDNANIQIRGVGSINANANPIYVVDGIIYESNPNIASEDISTVDILKDGASCAIYGTRGANGVILITTKRGKSGEAKVSFGTYYGIQNIVSGTPLQNTEETLYASEMYQQSLGGHSPILYYNPNAMDYNTDFISAISNDNAAMQNYNLTVSGGTKGLTYNVNTNYFKQDGILILSGYDRFTTRANAAFTKGKFSAFVSLGVNKSNKAVEPWGLYQYAQFQGPYRPPLNIDNSSIEVQGDNPDHVGFLAKTMTITDKRVENSYNVSANLKYEIAKGLVYHVNLGYSNYDYFRKQFQPQFLTYDNQGKVNELGSRKLAVLTQDNFNSTKTTIENVINYDKTFGKHKLGLLAGYTIEMMNSRTASSSMNDFISNSVQEFNGGSTLVSISGSSAEHNVIGKLARIQYSYAERYLFSASGRYDASSRMGSNNKYGFFPGVSVAWNVNEESFMKGIKQIQNLKLRASYGELGNEGIGDYRYSPYVIPNVDYVWGPETSDNLGLGAIQRGYANSDIKWETSISRNIGMDLSLFKGKFTFTADLYKNDKKDMLLNLLLPASTGTNVNDWSGYNSIVANIGNMVNKGIELAATYKGTTKFGMNWSVTGTFTSNNNEITSMGGVGDLALNDSKLGSWTGNDDVLTYMKVGYPAGSFFLVPTAGVIKNDEQLAEAKTYMPTAKLGDMMYVDKFTIDSDGDGILDKGDGKIDENDREYMGSGQPIFESGLIFNANYKGFDLSAQLFYSYGNKVYNGAKKFAYSTNRHKDMYNMWTPYNITSDIPTPSAENTRSRSAIYLEDGTFLRIRNLSLGYTLPKTLIKGIMDNARIYVTAQNPFTFTKYTGYDPEVGGNGVSTRGVDKGNYPITRKFLMGMQIDF